MKEPESAFLSLHQIKILVLYTRYIMGNHKPVSVYGATFNNLKNRPGVSNSGGYKSADAGSGEVFNVEDLATALIRFDNGSVISVEASFSLNTKHDKGDIEFFGTKGGAKLSPELELYSDVNGYLTNTQLDFPTALSFNGLFENEISHFLDCIIDGVPCQSPAEDGVEIMKILDAIYESARTGHEVTID